jgi:hypothetical protein
MEQMLNGISQTSLWITVVTVFGLVGVAVLIFDFVLKLRELRKPKISQDMTIMEKLENDNRRLKALETNDKRREGEFRLLLKSQMAMMQHLLDDNDKEKLKEVRDQINDYMVYGTTKGA